jgi:zinc protease
VDGRGAGLAEFEALGDYQLADELYAKSLAVTSDDVRRVAGTYLDPDAASAVFYFPPAADPITNGKNGNWPRVLATAPLVSPSPVIRELDARRASPGRPGTQHHEVFEVGLGGIDLLAQSKRGAGTVSLGLFFPGVREEEDESNAGISALFVRSALRGAAGMNAEELALAAESLGGTIGSVSGIPAIGWSITVPADQLPRAATLLGAVARESTLATDQVQIERELQSADAARVRDDMFRYPLQRIMGLAFPSDPYGLPPLGTPERVRDVTAEAVGAWKESLSSRRAVAVAVGDLDQEELVAGMQSLGNWPGGRGARRVAVPRFANTRAAEERGKKQSALAMAFAGTASNNPRRFAVAVLCDFLSGLAGRLFQVLREERALAYTVMASPWMQRRAGALLTYIATSPERENEARDAMLQALADVVAGKTTEAEVERARNYAAGLVEIGRQTTASVTSEILGAWTNGLIDELPEVPDRLRRVTVADVVRQAGEIFDPAMRAEFVVRGIAR